MKKTLIALLSLLPITTAVADNYKPASGQMIVRYHAEPTAARAIQFIKTGASYKGASFNTESGSRLNFDIVSSGDANSLEDEENLAALIANDPQVEFAEPDYIMQIKSTPVPPAQVGTPNDTRYSEQWYLHGAHGIDAPGMWAQMTNFKTVRIAVIDSGYANHPELDPVSTRTQFDIIDLKDQRRDGNGYDIQADDPGDWKDPGFCGTDIFGTANPPVSINSSWHGSHVASTIGAVTNNSEGIAGILFNQAEIMHIRAMGPCGGRASEIVAGIVLASGIPVGGYPYPPGSPVKVINLSLGVILPFCPESYKTGIRIAQQNGVIIVAASGNENIPGSQVTPANCPGVISVAATGPHGNKAYFSNFGPDISIAAPGGEIKIYNSHKKLVDSAATDNSALTILPYSNAPEQVTVTLHDGILAAVDSGQKQPEGPGYAYLQGTSMAAPMVTAVIGAMATVIPDLTYDQALHILQQTAQPFPESNNNDCIELGCGAGILNAAGAYRMAKEIQASGL